MACFRVYEGSRGWDGVFLDVSFCSIFQYIIQKTILQVLSPFVVELLPFLQQIAIPSIENDE